MSIDNATPEEWDRLRNSKASIAEAWNRIYDDDNAMTQMNIQCSLRKLWLKATTQ